MSSQLDLTRQRQTLHRQRQDLRASLVFAQGARERALDRDDAWTVARCEALIARLEEAAARLDRPWPPPEE